MRTTLVVPDTAVGGFLPRQPPLGFPRYASEKGGEEVGSKTWLGHPPVHLQSSFTLYLIASINLFKTHLGLDLSTGKPYMREDPQDLEEVSGIIGLAGETIGAVVLSFSRETAIQIISRFSDCKYTALSNIVLDGVGAAA